MTKATLFMNVCRAAWSTSGSLMPSRDRVVIEIAMAPAMIPMVSMHQMIPTARGRSDSSVRSITSAR